jgi:hypothetical protein
LFPSISVVTKTGKTPVGCLNPLSLATDLVGSKMCPFENKLSRPHQTVNQFLTKVMNFRHSIWKKHRCAEKLNLHRNHSNFAEDCDEVA